MNELEKMMRIMMAIMDAIEGTHKRGVTHGMQGNSGEEVETNTTRK